MAVSQTIATIPTAPSRADPANFVERHEAVLDRLETLPGEMNTWKDQVNSTQSQVNASELQAGQSATTATNAASLALSYSNAEQYAGGTTYDPGETVIGSNGTAYRRLNTSAAGDNPVTSTTGNWTPAITALGAMSTFDLICKIAGMQPTLYLNAKDQDYRIYSPATGLTRKALTDIVTTTRASDGAIFDAKGQLTQLTDDAPRVTFDPETGVGEGLLVEESRTNLLTYSEDFSNAAWLKRHVTVTANTETSPDKTLTADRLVESSGFPLVYRGVSISAGAVLTFSVFAKEDASSGKRYLALAISESEIATNNYTTARFDLLQGICTFAYTFTGSNFTNLVSEIKDVGGGWYRCSISVTSDTLTLVGVKCGLASDATALTGNASGFSSYTGDGTSGIYIWGAQLEAGSFPTSYIPTTTAAATRAADVIKIDGTAFSDVWAPDGGTLLIAATPSELNNVNGIFSINDGTNTNRIDLRTNGVSYIYGNAANLGNALTVGSTSVIAIRFMDGDFAYCVNGAIDITRTNTIPAGASQIGVGQLLGGYVLKGILPIVAYFSKPLPTATLQQLSALVI